MTAAVLAPVAPAVRRTGQSLPGQVWLEVRKSLSTRSGLALAGASVLLAPAAMGIAAGASSEPLDNVTGPIVVTGMLTALVLLSLGVLSTAGEWSHGTVQTTYLLSAGHGCWPPRRRPWRCSARHWPRSPPHWGPACWR